MPGYGGSSAFRAAFPGAAGLHEWASARQGRVRADGIPHWRYRLCRPGLAYADGVSVDRARHFAAGHRHDLDQAGFARHLGLCPGTAAVRHSGRHFPARQAFMNGPVRGKDVFVPMEFLIGGTDYAGQGWRMLMECLSTGRAISLPAIGTTSIKQALRVTSAYARVRRQFGIPVGLMEGVAEPLGEMVKRAYTYEASRRLTASMVDEGQRPAVISALLKYRTTEAMRDSVDDSFDIHGGRAIQ